MGHPLRNLFKTCRPSQTRPRSYNASRGRYCRRPSHGAITPVGVGTASDRFFNEIVFSETCWHWLEWRHDAFFRSEDGHILLLTLHSDLSNVHRGHWPLLTLYLPGVAKLAFFGFPEVLRRIQWRIFHRHVCSASWPCRRPIPQNGFYNNKYFRSQFEIL